MRKIILFFLGAILIIGAFFAANKIIESNKKVRPIAPKIVKTVFAESVTNGIIPITIPANGTLVAKNRLELYAEVQGVFRSSAHDFKAGQNYRRGETLLSIDASEYYASVQAAKSDFLNLVTSIMPDLRLDYPEAFPSWQAYLNNFDFKKSVPLLPAISSEKVKYFITGRGIFSSYYSVKNLEQRLGKYRITAPFSGILTEALVTKGSLIRQGQKLGEYIDPSVYELELSIEKAFSDLMKLGEKVTLTAMDSEKEYLSKVTRINGKIDQATQTIKVFVEVRGADLKEGMYLEARLSAKSEDNAIEISRKLLVNETQVFVLRDTILDIIEVEPVHFSDKTVILKGVPDGTRILSKPVSGAYAGMLVKEFKEAADPQDQSHL
ncbi:MAG: membrane fusion protein (multidrug efflux system) [Patescibacteria group bacterium]